MLTDYLKSEFVDSDMVSRLAQYQNHDKSIRYQLKVPVEMGDDITAFLRKATKPKYNFKRRASGPRHDRMAQTCLIKDATHFRFYFEPKPEVPYKRPAVWNRPKPTINVCQCCGQKL